MLQSGKAELGIVEARSHDPGDLLAVAFGQLHHPFLDAWVPAVAAQVLRPVMGGERHAPAQARSDPRCAKSWPRRWLGRS